ncbi:hypothetical protein BOTBODRAFT_144682 [Botryobasidium botryosum FD-172 SS1]|uniref:Uncharacterized protein n=1 Tax=Botryobasidium botryosum (strain FD-172 SS1) TaxID=930990 RepID=A0A067MWP1_BOTB1|nr:hypothetical protein BOTBODRAFT_144682 [Botryobasidium botryosum FD-172 SS1]
MAEKPATLSHKSLRLLDLFVASAQSDRNSGMPPCPAIDSLEHEEEHLNTVIALLSAKVAQARRRRNELAPINTTLPNEILSYIFQVGAREDIDDTVDPFPYFSVTVSHVCQLWRSVALATPALWSLFSYKTPTELEIRAQYTLLDVVLHVDILSPTTLSNIAATKLPRAGSIQIMVSHCWKDRNDLSWMEDVPAPHLSKFLITTIEAYDDKIPVRSNLPLHPFHGQHLSLREVSIGGIAIPWNTPLLSGLQLLQIEDICLEYHVDVAAFISILQSCPKLETLCLCEAGPMADLIDETMPTVFLPALRFFSWINGTHHASFQLLNHIVVPRTATINVSTLFVSQSIRHRKAEGFSVGLGTILQVMLSSCQNLTLDTYLDSTGVVRRSDFDRIEYEPQEKSICFSVGPDDEKLRNVMNVVRLHSPIQIQSVNLQGIGTLASEDLVQLLRALPNVEAVSFIDCGCETGLIFALSGESWGHSVRDISLTRSHSPVEVIISFAQSRPPHSLRHLSFHACNLITPATIEILRLHALEVVCTGRENL